MILFCPIFDFTVYYTFRTLIRLASQRRASINNHLHLDQSRFFTSETTFCDLSGLITTSSGEINRYFSSGVDIQWIIIFAFINYHEEVNVPSHRIISYDRIRCTRAVKLYRLNFSVSHRLFPLYINCCRPDISSD